MINETKNYTKSEGLGVVKLHRLARLNTSAGFFSTLKLFSRFIGMKLNLHRF